MSPEKKAAPKKNIYKNKKKQRTTAATFVFTLTKILIVFLIILCCATFGMVGGAIWGYIKTASPITPEMLQFKNLTTFIYDSKNVKVAQLRGLQNRTQVDHNDIPDYLRYAFVALEDQRFYQHPGIDIKGIANMVISFLIHGKEGRGGSTITQQLVRNITGDFERSNFEKTLRRKVQEQYRAIQLETKLTKDDILDIYMNIICMGEGCYGVQSASKMYFGKDVKDLSLAECAALAGITNNPSVYNPFTTEGQTNLRQRQLMCLKLMLEQKRIAENEYEQAIREELKFVDRDKAIEDNPDSQSYFVDQVINDVKKGLMEKYNMSGDIAITAIYNYGYSIYTTQDTDMQKAMDEVFINDKYFPAVKGRVEHSQAAMVILDPKTGQVKALYGGYGEKKGSLLLNRAAGSQMKRQAGSSFKPIAVYAPAIDSGLITPATIIDDIPVYMDVNNKEKPYPVNYESSKYSGLTSIHDAIIHSINVVAAKVYVLNPSLAYPYLKKVDLNRDKERWVSLALGGLEEGVNPLQMAAAFAPFVNRGIYHQPITYTKVVDKDGKVILEKKSKSNIVYSDERTPFIMTKMLQDVCTQGTAAPYGVIKNAKGEIIPTAGKTGTTSEYKDKWFVGYSPYYAATTWYGYDHPVPLSRAEYSQALIIWNAVMTEAHKKLKPVEFAEPAGIVRKVVCKYSGKIPSALCDKDPRGPSTREEVFIKGTEPSDNQICDIHISAKICKASKDIYGRYLLAGSYCPSSSVAEKVFIMRREPYMPLKPDDLKQYPYDWMYSIPEGEYCTVHGAPLEYNLPR